MTNQCLSCSLGPCYNRAVIETETNTRVAHLCFNCESELEKLRAEFSNDSIGKCFVCGEDARFLLPALQASLTTGENLSYPAFEYTISSDTPRLCHTHLEELVGKTVDR